MAVALGDSSLDSMVAAVRSGVLDRGRAAHRRAAIEGERRVGDQTAIQDVVDLVILGLRWWWTATPGLRLRLEEEAKNRGLGLPAL